MTICPEYLLSTNFTSVMLRCVVVLPPAPKWKPKNETPPPVVFWAFSRKLQALCQVEVSLMAMATPIS